MTIISSETVGSILKGNLDRASIPYMYVKHNEGTKGPHRHWIIWHNDIKDQTSSKSFGHRIRMNLIRSFERAGLFKVNKDHFQIRFYNKDVKDWLIYVKHEEDQVRMELYGENGDWLEFWNSITKEQSTEKKRKSQDEKKEYIKKWKRDDRIKDVQTAMETPDWVSIGTNIIAGIQKGLTDKAKELAETAARVAREALEAAEEELDINSPSGEFRKVGMYSDMGFANGLKSYAHLVTNQSTEVGSSALDSIKSAVAKVSDLIENGIDAVPTIRPVLDLTDIESEISRIGSMFSDSPVVSIGASINRANAQTNQNGVVNQSPQVTPSSYTFNQNNYSPKALSRSDIYRQTKNQFSTFERMAKA